MMKSLGQNPSDFLGNNNQNLDYENLNSMMKNLNIENYPNQIHNEGLGDNPPGPNIGNNNEMNQNLMQMLNNNRNNNGNFGNHNNKKKTKNNKNKRNENNMNNNFMMNNNNNYNNLMNNQQQINFGQDINNENLLNK